MEKSHARGRPKGMTSQIKLIEILKLFPEDGSFIQVKELKRISLKRGISPRTLFAYLEMLRRNLHLLKRVDESERPPKVYYKRITRREFFSDVDPWGELEYIPYFTRQWMMAGSAPQEVKDIFEKSFIEKYSAKVLACILQIEKRAGEIEDRQKREEYFDVAWLIYIKPLLSMLPDSGIETKHWGNASGIIQEIVQRSDRELEKKAREILPKRLSSLLLETLEATRQGNTKRFVKDSKKFDRLVKKMEVVKRK